MSGLANSSDAEEFCSEFLENATRIERISTNISSPNDSEVLRETFVVYGLALVVSFFALCWARLLFPDAFNIRKADYDDDDKGPCLAKDQHGLFSWCWKLFQIPSEDFLEENGLDATCLVRICSMGYRFSATGMFVAIWLLPVYSTAGARAYDEQNVVEDELGEDELVEITTGRIPNDSPRFIATAVATYVVFGHAMYIILKEMEWFTAMRHRFLMRPTVRNYAVYIRNLPEESRSNYGMKEFLEKALRGGCVQESLICVRTKNLRKKVAERDTVIEKLEHAVAEEEVCGERPRHAEGGLPVLPNVVLPNKNEVDSVEFYAERLKSLNDDIAACIDALHGKATVEPIQDQFDTDVRPVESWARGSATPEETEQSFGLLSAIKANTKCLRDIVIEPPVRITGETTGLITKAATKAVKLVLPDEDGELFSAGFVVFASLATTQAALQMVLHEEPYVFEILEAPDPEDVYWPNTGRENQDLQVGRIISFGLSAVICLFWTIPVSFVAGLSSVHGLRQGVEFVDDLLTAVPALEPLFELLAPQLLVMLNSLLPILLTYATTFEGNISGAVNEASLFSKLAAFMIIQTFFVSAISGGVLAAIAKVVSTPKSLVDLLATTLPAQSTFFIQLSFVSTVTVFITEGLGLTRIGLAVARRHVGPNLTARERRKTVMGLRPMTEVKEFEYGRTLSSLVLLFMAYLVYCVIAPLMSFVSAFCFVLLEALNRHQMVYVYRPTVDSGGRIWLNFIKILTICLLIAELTVVGLMALKKAVVATALFPLVAVTIIFPFYLRERHFLVADHLPARLCLEQDSRTGPLSAGVVRDSYLPPERRSKRVLPELSRQRLEELGLVGDEYTTTVSPNGVACHAKKIQMHDGVFDGDGECHVEKLDVDGFSLAEEERDA